MDAGRKGSRPAPAAARRLPAALLLGAFALAGCAHLPIPGLPRGPGPEVRAEAPADYDVLVALEHERSGEPAPALAAYQRAAAKDPGSAFLQRKVAEGFFRASRFEEALEHATRAFEIDPGDGPTRLFLGQLHRARRDPTGAERVLLEESGEPFDESAALLLYQIYLEAGRPDAALGVAQALAESEPFSLRSQVALAMAFDQLGRPEEAEAALRRALEIEPENLRVYGLLAQNLQKRGLREREIEVYRGVLRDHPHHQRTLQSLADAQLSQNDLAGAIATLEQIERHHPEDLRSVVRLGFLKYEARLWAEAASRFERFLEDYPDEYEVVFFLGGARRRAGDEEGALEVLARIPEDHKNYADARTEIAALLERRGDYAGALVELERANAASPAQALELYAATLRAKAGDFDGAIAHLENLLVERPSDDELLYNLGLIYGEAKRPDDAIRYMRLALEQNPDNASALNYVGYSFAEKGIRLDEAEGMIRRALELRPGDGYITDSLGWVYYMRARPLVESGRAPEARELLERALREVERADELTGGDPVVSEHLGDIHLLRGEKQRALERFEEAVGLDPRVSEQPELFEKLERLRQELLDR